MFTVVNLADSLQNQIAHPQLIMLLARLIQSARFGDGRRQPFRSRIMRSLAREFCYRALSAAPLVAWRRVIPRDVIGMCYHLVSDEAPLHVRNLYAVKSIAEFRRDLEFLRDNFQVVHYDAIVANRLHGQPLPANADFISFDDGFSECHSIVGPLLREFGFPAIFFINTDFVDNRDMFLRHKVSLCIDKLQSLPPDALGDVRMRLNARFELRMNGLADIVAWLKRLNESDEATVDEACAMLDVDAHRYLAEKRPYLTSAQIRELSNQGFTIGSHTRRHGRLSSLNDAARIKAEIVDSCQDVARITGQSVVPFAFPYDGVGVDRHLLASIRSESPMVGLLFDTQGLERDEPFIVNRICCDRPPSRSAPQSNLSRIFRDSYYMALGLAARVLVYVALLGDEMSEALTLGICPGVLAEAQVSIGGLIECLL